MTQLNFAIFLTLNGKAEEAITFYQEVFNGELFFKITNQEFKNQLNPELELKKGTEHFISHSILKIGETELQIADNPFYENMEFSAGTQISFSMLTKDLQEAKSIYNKIMRYSDVVVYQAPSENEFADFYAIVKDPFGQMIQLTHEREKDPSKKGSK